MVAAPGPPPHADGAPPVAELVHRGDLDALVRAVDRLAVQADWDGVVDLRRRCLLAAEELGRQLWGPAQYADYRLALEAPAPLAASVVVPGAAPFALGPLTEVVAQGHAWSELAPHLDVPVIAATVAQERVIRGEDLRGDDRAHAGEVGLPLVRQPWEPAYPLPAYRADELSEPAPAPPDRWESAAHARPGRPRSLPRLEAALRDLVAPWEEASDGEVHVAAVAGDAAAAVAALSPEPARLARLDLAGAFAAMAWAAASGGAHARRRGLAAGRSAAWWVGHVVTGLAFPADPDELEFELEELAWYAWDTPARSSAGGWRLRLVVEQPREGWAAAVDAYDPVPTDPTSTGPTSTPGSTPTPGSTSTEET